MGQLFLYDWLNGHSNVKPFNLFSFDDIDHAFEKVQQVKYSQTVCFFYKLFLPLILDFIKRRQWFANYSIPRWPSYWWSHLANNQDG